MSEMLITRVANVMRMMLVLRPHTSRCAFCSSSSLRISSWMSRSLARSAGVSARAP